MDGNAQIQRSRNCYYLPLPFSIFAFLCIVLISIAAIPNFEDAEVQADGLFEEKLPPASLGDRQIALSTRIFPPLLTNQTSDVQKYIQFGGNKTVPQVFYFITIAKDDDLIMKELFHSHSGNLTLSLNNEKSNATNGSNSVKVLAAREGIMGAWTSKNSADNITIQAPLFNEGGLYEFKVEILGIDNDTNIFKAINSLEFD